MGLLSGAITIRRYRLDPVFHGTHEDVLAGLKAGVFEPLRPSEIGPTAGWVHANNMLDIEFSHEDVFVGPVACFSLRIDERRPSARLVRDLAAKELRETMQAEGRQRPHPGELALFREAVEHRLIPKCLPSPRIIDLMWDVPANTVYIFSAARKSQETIAGTFFQSFSRVLHPVHAARLAAEQADGDTLWNLLDAMDYSFAGDDR